MKSGRLRGRLRIGRWTVFALEFGLTAVLIGILAVLARPEPVELQTTVVQSGLNVPWDLAFTPDGLMLVTEREGRIRVYASAAPGAELLSTTTVPDVRAEVEAGVMGIAVDRDLAANPFAYVCASLDTDGADGDAPWHNELLRYRLAPDGQLTLDDAIFAEPMVAAIHHNGCAVEMDASRHLWLTMGDGNVSAAEVNPPQDPNSLNGKILRLNADGSVPDDNPILPGAAGRSAVYSMGHRNPQGLAIRADGLILAAEHGTDTDDEVNRIVAGGNYGYACWSGTANPGPAQQGSAGERCRPASDYLPPLWASGNPTLATSGAVFLPDDGWGSWGGSLIVSTLKEGDLRRFVLSDGDQRLTLTDTLLDQQFGRLRAVVIGPNGALFISTSNADGNDQIIRVEPGG
jgi:glucose/arabinose dehydrogenase